MEDAPGARWEYSTGNSMLLARIALENRGDQQWNNFEWPRQTLFKPLSMVSALIEPQANGLFAGGSLAYMKALDWARMGLLYRRDGVWVDGTRILPAGFVDYAKTGGPASPDIYAAQLWLGSTGSGVPYYYFSGFRDQNVWILDSKDLVVVRLSMPRLLGGGFSTSAFLTPIADAFPDAL